MRRFLLAGAEVPVLAMSSVLVDCNAVYAPMPSISRNPQFRQKRSSPGIVEWQFEQITWPALGAGIEISEFSDIGDPPVFT
jgi:hypothetical protein